MLLASSILWFTTGFALISHDVAMLIILVLHFPGCLLLLVIDMDTPRSKWISSAETTLVDCCGFMARIVEINICCGDSFYTKKYSRLTNYYPVVVVGSLFFRFLFFPWIDLAETAGEETEILTDSNLAVGTFKYWVVVRNHAFLRLDIIGKRCCLLTSMLVLLKILLVQFAP